MASCRGPLGQLLNYLLQPARIGRIELAEMEDLHSPTTVAASMRWAA
jgi:hypothetical protein